MEILKRGAEALLILDEYEGKPAIVKKRIKKGYRAEALDERLRKERTRREARLLREARALGVPTPKVYAVNEEDATVIMEYVQGERVKELLERLSEKEIKDLFEKIGFYIGKLHSGGLIHGDLTTSNMILRDGEIYFIDFGLGFFSKRLEDQGVDLKLLKEAIEATHPKLLNVCWKALISGYSKAYINSEQVLKKVDEIEKRARYSDRKV